MEVERLSETDIIWVDGKPTVEPTHVVTFFQNEEGFSTFAAGMGLIGESKLVAKVFSKLMHVPAFNEIPDPIFPEWRIYETHNSYGDRFFILRILHAHPTMASNGDETDNQFVWLYTYPIYRDIICALCEVGAFQTTFFVSDLVSEVSNTEPVEKTTIFDFTATEEEPYSINSFIPEIDVKIVEKDITIMPYCWIWCSLFVSFCPSEDCGVWSVVFPPPTTFLDRDNMDKMLEYCENVLGLGYDEEKLLGIIESLSALEEMATQEFEMGMDFFLEGFDDDNI